MPIQFEDENEGKMLAIHVKGEADHQLKKTQASQTFPH